MVARRGIRCTSFIYFFTIDWDTVFRWVLGGFHNVILAYGVCIWNEGMYGTLSDAAHGYTKGIP